MSRKDALIRQGNATAEPLTNKHKIKGYQQIIEEMPGRNSPRKKSIPRNGLTMRNQNYSTLFLA